MHRETAHHLWADNGRTDFPPSDPRITESLGLEQTSKTPKPNPNPWDISTARVPSCHISTVLEHLQKWGPPHFPGQLCQRLTTLWGRNCSIQPEPPLVLVLLHLRQAYLHGRRAGSLSFEEMLGGHQLCHVRK